METQLQRALEWTRLCCTHQSYVVACYTSILCGCVIPGHCLSFVASVCHPHNVPPPQGPQKLKMQTCELSHVFSNTCVAYGFLQWLSRTPQPAKVCFALFYDEREGAETQRVISKIQKSLWESTGSADTHEGQDAKCSRRMGISTEIFLIQCYKHSLTHTETRCLFNV